MKDLFMIMALMSSLTSINSMQLTNQGNGAEQRFFLNKPCVEKQINEFS